ncbi:hypothetical protein [Bartonella sp. AC134YNZD]|uniref:hypothetical protein n=1 Tax=Bartonella sp. AC134YNZD TaxID=3243446 RepID=UPI0035CF11A6
MGNGALISAKAVGTISLQFSSGRSIHLSDVYYFFGTFKNLIFVYSLIRSGYSVTFSDIVTISMNKDFYLFWKYYKQSLLY